MRAGLGQGQWQLLERLVLVPASVLALHSPAAGTAVVVSTQNVQLTLPPTEARHDMARAASGSPILFTQEMGHRHARRLAPPGWGTAHYLGSHRRGDCATVWDRSRWARIRTELVPLTWTDSRRRW